MHIEYYTSALWSSSSWIKFRKLAPIIQSNISGLSLLPTKQALTYCRSCSVVLYPTIQGHRSPSGRCPTPANNQSIWLLLLTASAIAFSFWSIVCLHVSIKENPLYATAMCMSTIPHLLRRSFHLGDKKSPPPFEGGPADP